jgi:hypothetical protein
LKGKNEISFIDSDAQNVTYPLSKTSIAYLRSDNHPGIFCLVTPELNTIELNFLQAVKTYKASVSEKPYKLHELHHEQASAGLKYFKSEKNQVNISLISKQALSTAENKALNNLIALIKIAPTEQKKKTLQRTVDLIKQGTFASKGLPKSINDFFVEKAKLMKEPLNFIDQLFIDVLDRYDFGPNSSEAKDTKVSSVGIINPQIVLTQSFE